MADEYWYDNGGWLPSVGAARNDSGLPEPVFSAAQWEILRKYIPASGASDSLGDRGDTP